MPSSDCKENGMKNIYGLLAATILVSAASLFGTAGPAQAGPIIQGNTDSFAVSGSRDGIAFGMSGTVGFNTVSNSQLVFDVSITNTSVNNPAVSNDNRLVSFGFDISGTTVLITSVGDNSPTWTATLTGPGQNFPGFSNIDVCVYSGTNCSGGGGTAGLNPGSTLNLLLTMNGTFVPPLSLDTVSGRFQSTGSNQNGSDNIGVTPRPIPEPGTLALLGAGLFGLGVASRRRPATLEGDALQAG